MTAIYYGEPPAKQNCPLFVFLPGYGDKPDIFEKEGFIRDLMEREKTAAAVAVDANVSYYFIKKNIVERLKRDVIAPAERRGCDRIWLVGTSLGGLGALLYSEKYGGDITGAVLLGPYLGEDKVIGEIYRAGGIYSWTPGRPDKHDWQKNLWLWLQEYGRRKKRVPVLYLGYGKDDRYVDGQILLAKTLPPERVVSMEGGHDWSTWRRLWGLFLERLPFQEPGMPK